MKREISGDVGVLLLRKGFTVKSVSGSCFDMFARKDGAILFIKILEDANSIRKEYAEEMKRISAHLGASPIIIAGKAGQLLEENVVYSRFGVFTLSLGTFRAALEDRLPVMKSTQAGITASLVGEKLRQEREKRGYSLNELGRKIGVSGRMISRYESGESEVSVKKAAAISTALDHSVFRGINIFSMPGHFELKPAGEISRKYGALGFDSLETRQAPFDIVAKKEKELILTSVGDRANPQLKIFSNLLDADKLVIFNKQKPREAVPSLMKKEFLEFESSEELVKFLREFE